VLGGPVLASLAVILLVLSHASQILLNDVNSLLPCPPSITGLGSGALVSDPSSSSPMMDPPNGTEGFT